MTVKGKQDQGPAVVRADNEEQVPTYQEAVAGSTSSSSAASSSQPAPSGGGKAAAAAAGPTAPSGATNLYPFPSASGQQGYGQSPYQADGAVRIAIVPQSGNGGGPILPLHATAVHQGPRAGRRFLVAFFWAIVLYLILGAVTGTLIEMAQGSNQPRTPPGWKHHHHGHNQVKNDKWFSLPRVK